MCKAPLAEGGISNAVEVNGDPRGLYTVCDECLAERCVVSLDDSGATVLWLLAAPVIVVFPSRATPVLAGEPGAPALWLGLTPALARHQGRNALQSRDVLPKQGSSQRHSF